jgi:hypothetical protein
LKYFILDDGGDSKEVKFNENTEGRGSDSNSIKFISENDGRESKDSNSVKFDKEIEKI